MPCYEERTVSVEFKVENIELLKNALANLKLQVQTCKTSLSFYHNGLYTEIDLTNGKITNSMSEQQLTNFTNQIKRAYSLQVIDEVAKKQKWMKKKLNDTQFQLQRF